MSTPTALLGANPTLAQVVALLEGGGLAPALTEVAKQTASYTAAPNQLVPMDATSGAITGTFPTAPPDGTRQVFKKVDASGNAVNLALGGSDVFNIAGGPTTGSLTLQNQALVAQYDATHAIWYVISTDVPLSGLDARYLGIGANAVSATTAGSTTGNAATATKLATPRNINGVAFDGSANITISSTDATKIPLSVVTAKGDIIVATGSGAVAREAVGSNHQIVQADSTQANGLKWVNKPFLDVIADFGADPTGGSDSTTAFTNAIGALPPNGGTIDVPEGVYVINTVTSGVILNFLNLTGVTFRGHGKGSILQVNSATATELIRIDTCTQFTMRDMLIEIEGTANIDKAVHYTTAASTSAHDSLFENLTIVNGTTGPPGAVRNVYDVMTTASSNVIYSGMAVFAAGDVGGIVTLTYSQNYGIFRSTISSVATLSTTLSANLTLSGTTVHLTSALSTMPASGWSLKVGTEHMYVTAGGNTTTLTVQRGQGSDLIQTTHNSGDTAVVYKATLANTVPFSTATPAAMLRVEISTAHMNYGLAIGLDHPGVSSMDIADNRFSKITVEGAVIAGIAIGNGVSGNILSNVASHIGVDTCTYGVRMDGGCLNLEGGEGFGLNIVDVEMGQQVSQPVIIDGMRSENSGMIYRNVNGASSGPSLMLSNWMANQVFNEELVQLRHQISSTVEIRNVQIYVSYTVQSQTQLVIVGGASNPSSLVASGISHNCANIDPFITINCRREIHGAIQLLDVNGNAIGNAIIAGATVLNAPVVATSASTLTPDITANSLYVLSALAAALTINAPTGTAIDGQELGFRFKDNGTARALTWNAAYRIVGTTLPTTTVISKTVYIRTRYNAEDSVWDVIDVKQQA